MAILSSGQIVRIAPIIGLSILLSAPAAAEAVVVDSKGTVIGPLSFTGVLDYAAIGFADSQVAEFAVERPGFVDIHRVGQYNFYYAMKDCAGSAYFIDTGVIPRGFADLASNVLIYPGINRVTITVMSKRQVGTAFCSNSKTPKSAVVAPSVTVPITFKPPFSTKFR